jgi:hypothetical protein
MRSHRTLSTLRTLSRQQLAVGVDLPLEASNETVTERPALGAALGTAGARPPRIRGELCLQLPLGRRHDFLAFLFTL